MKKSTTKAEENYAAIQIILQTPLSVIKAPAIIIPVLMTIVLSSGALLSSCSPSVKVEAPDKPITINLNVKIEHEIRVKVEKELEDVFSKDSGLF